MGFLDTDLDEVREFLKNSGYPNRFVSFEGCWRDYDVYSTCPYSGSSDSDQEVWVLETIWLSKDKFRLYFGSIPSLPITSDDTSIEDLTTNQMLCNRHYVDYIDSIGKAKFADWDLNAYLCGKMGPGEYKPDLDLTTINYSEINGLVLNGSEGVHYGYELFLKPLRYWPLRGAPFFWCEFARELTDYVLPIPQKKLIAVVQKLKDKYGIPDNGEVWIPVPTYAAGVHSGMSSGALFADGVNEMAKEIAIRNLMYKSSPKAFVEEYVIRFESFPYVY